MSDDLRTRIAKALYGQLFWIKTPFDDQPDKVKDPWLFEADIVIRELRPQLTAWARMCVTGGGMTPAAERQLHNILGQYDWNPDG